MKRTVTCLVGGAILSAAVSAPAFAQIDAATLTCGQFYASDSDKTGSANAIVEYLNDARNATAENVAAAEVVKNLTNEQVQGKIDNVCEGQAVDAVILKLMQAM